MQIRLIITKSFFIILCSIGFLYPSQKILVQPHDPIEYYQKISREIDTRIREYEKALIQNDVQLIEKFHDSSVDYKVQYDEAIGTVENLIKNLYDGSKWKELKAILARISELAPEDIVDFEEITLNYIKEPYLADSGSTYPESVIISPVINKLRDKIFLFFDISKSNIEKMQLHSAKIEKSPTNNTKSSLDEISGKNLKEKEVSLTFDDGPHKDRTLRIMQSLLDNSAEAAFFEVGKSLKKERLRKISQLLFENGFTLGNHSFDHPNFKGITMDKAESEIAMTQDLLAEITDTLPVFFRFPYGARGEKHLNLLKEYGLISVYWRIDSLDWKLKDPVKIMDMVQKQLGIYGNRGIILFHDIQEATALLMPKFLEYLKVNHFKTVSLEYVVEKQ